MPSCVRALAAAVMLLLGAASPVAGQINSAFTYQGELRSGNQPYVGPCDVRVSLWTDPFAGSSIGLPITFLATTDDLGRFTITPDFGVVLGAPTWLKIEVRTPNDPTDSAPYIVLSPRQVISAAPMARKAEEANIAGTASIAVLANNALNLNSQPASFYTNASNLSSGTLNSARLSGTYSNALTLSNAANAFTGSGSGLTALNAGNLSSGTLADARLSGTYSGALTLSNTSNTFTGSGAGLTSLNASNLASGTVPSARLSGIYTGALTLSNVSNVFAGSGASLTALNASSVSSGTLADARLSSNVPLLSVVNAFAANNTFAGDVGIRTTTPAAALHVNQNTDVTATGGGSFIVGLTTSTNIRMDGNEVQALNNGAVANFGMQVNGGNLGIGTLSPDAKLEVAGDAHVTGNLLVDGAMTIPAQTRVLWLGPDAFALEPGGNNGEWHLNLSSGGISYLVVNTTVGTGTAEAGANVMLPQGAIVTELRVWVADASTNNNLSCQLIRISPASFSGFGTPTTMGTATSSGDTGDFFVAAPSYADTTISSATIDNLNYRYRLHVQATTSAVANFWFYGARITYTVTSPLP